jgi:hypothetical protein
MPLACARGKTRYLSAQGVMLKPRFGPVVPGLCAFLLALVALGAGALGSLGAANDALTYGNANAQGSGSFFTVAFVCGSAAIGIVVWLIKRPK